MVLRKSLTHDGTKRGQMHRSHRDIVGMFVTWFGIRLIIIGGVVLMFVSGNHTAMCQRIEVFVK
jgi:hypothetical protein